MPDTFIASVVIPTYNGREKVCSLLKKLVTQVTGDIELIVVVDGSTDGTAEEIKKLTLEVQNFVLIEQGNKGRSGARNSGAANARSPTIIFFDDDIIPAPNLIQRHIEAHKTIDIVVGALNSYNAHGNNEMLEFSEYLNKKWTIDIQNNTVPYITAANFSIKKKIFDLMGGFDNRLTDSEDLDLAVRIKNKGYQIIPREDLIAYITLNATFSETFNRLKEYKKGREVLHNINAYVKDYIPVEIKNPLKRIFFYCFSFSILYRLADRGFFLFMPKGWRMKLYDWMMTGNMLY